jgi:hypothetical protein
MNADGLSSHVTRPRRARVLLATATALGIAAIALVVVHASTSHRH